MYENVSLAVVKVKDSFFGVSHATEKAVARRKESID